MSVLEKFTYILLTSVYLFTGCTKTEYSPNQKFDINSPVDINEKSIDRLLSESKDDTIRFILTGDTQRSYDNASDFVKTANAIPGTDFVVIAGDISDFGLLQEMEWVHKIYSGLQVPYIGVIGNHDLSANGEDVFKRMYGKINYSFVYDSIKFICHNTNSREYNFDGKVPDMEWLSSELKPESQVKAYIALGHVPPFALDFDEKMEDEYVSVLSSVNTLGAMYAHVNKRGTYYYEDEKDEIFQTQSEHAVYKNDPVPFIVTNAIQNREFLLIEIIDGKLSSKVIKY